MALRIGWPALILALANAATGTAAYAETMTIQGSSTFANSILTPNRAEIESLSGQSLKVVGIRSDVGLLRLLARQSEFAIISTSLQRAIDSVRASEPGSLTYQDLIAVPIAKVPVAFAVNPANRVRKANIDMLRRILDGEVSNWRALGGADKPVRVVYVEGGDGVTLTVAGDLFDARSFTPADPIRVSLSAQVVKVVEQEPRALGVAPSGLVRDHKLPVLATDRVIEQQLSMVTLGRPTSAQQAVIDAVKRVVSKWDVPSP